MAPFFLQYLVVQIICARCVVMLSRYNISEPEFFRYLKAISAIPVLPLFHR
jgi:hypothetical protein